MPKRKKRAKKSIESIKKQIKIHEEKLVNTTWEPLIAYYHDEIEELQEYKKHKEEIVYRKKKRR